MGAVNIIGAGMAGLSAAISLSEMGIRCNLISVQASERAQSVLAEGGINAALNCMEDGDTPDLHFADTMKAGVYLADENAVRGLVDLAPEIVKQLRKLGVPFNTAGGKLLQRPFGGQTRVRTVFSRSSTGKAVMTALTDKVRFHEAKGLVTRYPHHELSELEIRDGKCTGVAVSDLYSGKRLLFRGPVILAFGGMNGLFPGLTTGTTANSGNALARVFSQGVVLSNLEMIQYHPTTISISGKRCLISEAARGEGGRLYIERDGRPWYFMEEKYPVLKNLMPRDVVSREMFFVSNDSSCSGPVFLDMTGIPQETWKTRLSDLRSEIEQYTGLDCAVTPVPVSPGIHYFMGGIDTDSRHRTNIAGLFAAGECCSQYHGANRLGGNSMLGAMYGGHIAALEASAIAGTAGEEAPVESEGPLPGPMPASVAKVRSVLSRSMGIVREEKTLKLALDELEKTMSEYPADSIDFKRILLAQAIIRSALLRKESRGAHYRSDYPEKDDSMLRMTTAAWDGREEKIEFR